MKTLTHNHFTAPWILSGTTPVPKMFTRSHPFWSLINHPLFASSIYYDPWHPPCSIYMPDSLFAQSLSKFFLVNLFAWHSPLHTPYISSFTQSLSSFCNTCPYHCSLFRCSTEIMSSNPSLSLNPLLVILSCSFIIHIHLTILISAHWSATSFSFLRARLTSMQRTTSHTTAVQSPSHFQWYILIGKQWYQLP